MDQESKPPRKQASRKRRLVMLGIGVGLGIVCRFVPPEYQGPCGLVTKFALVFVGG